VIELSRDAHPFFVASQYHPEFKSRPERPAPLFREFVGAALARVRDRAPAAAPAAAEAPQRTPAHSATAQSATAQSATAR
jgi:hypothetical protein